MFTAFLAMLRASFLVGVIVPEYKGIHWSMSFLGAELWRAQYPGNTPVIYSIPRFNIVQRFERAAFVALCIF